MSFLPVVDCERDWFCSQIINLVTILTILFIRIVKSLGLALFNALAMADTSKTIVSTILETLGLVASIFPFLELSSMYSRVKNLQITFKRSVSLW